MARAHGGTVPASRTPKVVVYLYCGQGTVNVPRWFPMGKRLPSSATTISIAGPELRMTYKHIAR